MGHDMCGGGPHMGGPMGMGLTDVEGMANYGDWSEQAYWGSYDNLSLHLQSVDDSRSAGMNMSDSEYLSSI
jgi:hypothetical protein